MKLIASLILTFLALTGAPIGQAWLSPLTATLIEGPSQHQLLQPAPHRDIAQPTITGDAAQIAFSAVSSYAMDIDSARTLYDHDSNHQLPIASITKLVTAMVILHNHSLSETVTVP